MDENSKTNLLCIAGMIGLSFSMALFFDARKNDSTESSCTDKRTRQVPLKAPVKSWIDDAGEEEEEEEEEDGDEEEEEEEEEEGEEEKQATDEEEQDDRLEDGKWTRVDPDAYKALYLNKRNERDDEKTQFVIDHSYRGDGSDWSKRLYAIKEAYRRSREATPVDPSFYRSFH